MGEDRWRLGTILASAPDIMLLLDAEGTCVEILTNQDELLFKGPDSLIGKRLHDILPVDVADAALTAIRRAIDTGKTQSLEYALNLSDGTHWFEGRTSPLAASRDSSQQVVWIAQDITARKRAELRLAESERRFRRVFDFGSIGMVMTDTDHNIIDANPHFCNLLGYQEHELIGRRMLDLLHPDDCGDKPMRALSQGLKAGVDYAREEERFIKKDGAILQTSVTISCVRDVDNWPASIVVMVEDITGRKWLEDELFKLQKLESLGVLAGGIAHDFNNILTAVFGSLSLATSYCEEDSPLGRALNIADTAACRAQELTHQLLTFSKGGEPIRRLCRIDELVREAAKFSLSGADAVCDFHFADDLWPCEVDAGQISRVIQNLVINALQAMASGGRIVITAKNIVVPQKSDLPVEPGPYVQLTVEDRGSGIEEAKLSSIFDPFYSTKEEGSGLGLSVAHSIVTRHGGLLSANSRVGEGTTMTVRLPAMPLSTPVVTPRPSPAPAKGRSSILVMDDDDLIRTVCGDLLHELGYDVTTTENGETALSAYQSRRESGGRYDLVIADLTVPGGMGGVELAMKLQQLDPGALVLASSGYSNDPIATVLKEKGFAGFLPKPYDLKTIGDCLEELLS